MQGKTFKKLGLIGATSLISLLIGSAPAHAQDPSGVKYDRKSQKAKSNIKLDTKFKKQKEAEEKARKRKVNMMSGAEFAK